MEVELDVQPHLLNLSAYINQNLEKDLPLSSLAKRVGLSPFHFHRKFGAYFGESLHQHIKRLRLERAAYALVHGSTPVREIARDSGYKTVSAFSHAFSGFAGESPTRYRNLGAGKRDEATVSPAAAPDWLGELEPIEFAFVRAKGSGMGQQRAIGEALDLLAARVGTMGDALDGDDRAFPYLVATSDLYRVANGSDYRLDVGVDAARVPVERRSALGIQTMPGGRYARFDFHCAPDEVMSRCLSAALNGLQDEKPRLSQVFLRFDRDPHAADGDDAARDYRVFMPLAG